MATASSPAHILEMLLTQIRSYLPTVNEERIRRAFAFAEESHRGQLRYSGEPFILHPLGALENLLFLKPDEDAILATLLHDVPEDTDRTLADIEQHFGKEVAHMTAGLEKLKLVRRRHTVEGQMENLRKLFLAMAQDLRVVLIKLADRLHNMQTLQHVPLEKQKRIAQETMEIYAPIASRLGIHEMKWRLEDLAFRYLEPDAHATLQRQMAKHASSREEHIRYAQEQLEQCLKKEGIQGAVEGRVKHVYSIYRKMKKKNAVSVDDIFDLFAMRIILPDRTRPIGEPDYSACYGMLGSIHSRWVPLVGRFKDYISVPKVNGYQSLHTTVMGLSPRDQHQPTEVQIRTQGMHRESEYGIASHWWYKDAGSSSATVANGHSGVRSTIEWLRGLARLQEEIQSNTELAESLRVDIFHDRIFVVTPQGDVKDLPVGATPVDFAYAIHSQVGHRCYAAKVNGTIVPLNSELRNGQVVEIVTKSKAEPSRYWLSFAKTNLARTRIREWFRNLDRDKTIQEGKNLLNQHLQRLGKPVVTNSLSQLRELGDMRAREKALEQLGNGTVTVPALLRKLFPNDAAILSFISPQPKPSTTRAKARSSGVPKVLIGGEKNLPSRFGPCCRPTKEDAIVGYVTRGKGVTIHRVGCKMLRRYEHRKERLVSAFWAWPDQDSQSFHRVKLSVEANDRVGLLRDMSAVVADAGVNIVDVHTSAHSGFDRVTTDFSLEVRSYEQYETLLALLERLPGVVRLNNVPVAVTKNA